MTFRSLLLCSLLISIGACKSGDDNTEAGPFVQTHPYVALTDKRVPILIASGCWLAAKES